MIQIHGSRFVVSRRQLLAASVATAAAVASRGAVAGESNDTVSHSAESLHQEPLFAAGAHRVFHTLTAAGEFDRLMEHSDAYKSMGVQHKPAVIDAKSGGAFALFGGYITGRFIELVPDQLIVQAWRVGSWQPGIYSLARFEFREHDGHTTVILDHNGFPTGQADHLAAGWYANYWNPLHALVG